MATGQPAFSGASTAIIFTAILRDDPPRPSRLNPELPLELDHIVMKALEKDRELRYQRAADVRTDSKRLLRDTTSTRSAIVPALSSPAPGDVISSPETTPTTPQGDSSDSAVIAGLVKRHKKSLTALLVAVTMIAATLVYVLYRAANRAPSPPVALQFTRVTSSGDVQRADLSPDGKYVVYVRWTGGKDSIWLRQLATDRDVQIVALDQAYCRGLAFSPDGSYVYFVRRDPLSRSGDLYQVPALGGIPRKMPAAGISGSPAFSPDGQRVAFVRDTNSDDSLVVASLDGSGERVLISYKRPEGIAPYRVAWSPDGKTLAFCHYSPNWVLTTIPVEGGPAQPVAGAQGNSGILDLTWLPKNRHLLVAGVFGESPTSQLYEVSLSAGTPRQITHDLTNYGGVRVRADAATVLALQDQVFAAIEVVTPGQEAETRSLSAGDQNDDGRSGLAWTPAGRIVYYSAPNARADLWEVGADGSPPQRLTSSSGGWDLGDPAVAPRGDFIALTRWDETIQTRIWRMDMDGSNLKQLSDGTQDVLPAISPDGKWIIFTRLAGGNYTLMKVPSEGGPETQMTDYGSRGPSVSPDGKWIACEYFPGRNQPTSVAVIPFAGGPPAKVFALPRSYEQPIRWTPDGRAVSFINSVNGVDNIWQQSLSGGPPEPVTHYPSGKIFYFDWSHDGRVALSRGTEPSDALVIKNFR